MLRSVIVPLAACVIGLGCSSSKPLSTSSQSLVSLDSYLKSTAPAERTLAEYKAMQAGYVTGLKQQQITNQKKAGSSTAKVKNGIGASAALLGLAGLIASAVVEDEDDKSKIAQSSAMVSSVGGIVAMLPIGKGTAEAGSVAAYLGLEIPAFEKRWPAHRTVSLTADEWFDFEADAKRIQAIVSQMEN